MPGLKTEGEWLELHCRSVLRPPQKGRARSQLSPSRTPWVGFNISFGQALLASFEMVVLKYLYMRNKRRSYASPRLSHIDFLTLQCRATVVARNYGEPVSLPVQMVDLHHRPKKEMSRCPHDPVIEIFQIPPVARIFLGFRWIYVIITTSITITTSISISIVT